MFRTGLALISAGILSIGFLTPGSAAPPADPGREIIPPNDGFAATPIAVLPLGTTGGTNATAPRTVTATNRSELIAALNYPDASPKLIYVRGTIDVNVDDAGRPLTCKDYQRSDPATGEPYSLHAYLTMYDPAGSWGRTEAPEGGQENARKASAAAQEQRVRIRIPPNTTVFGQGADATLIGAAFDIAPANLSAGNAPMNVIIRNLNFQDVADCFPEWDPLDGPTGNWNSSYDAISVRHATHVWIDHNRFADVRSRDDAQPAYFSRQYQMHDGHVDITDESDLITVSWNQFASHDKVMLIGNADGALVDRNKLHVTLHHNLFDGVGQRMPRVRFGQVHVYNNVYRADRNTNYRSSWGAGVESQIYAENNYFELGAMFGPMEVIDVKKGTRLTAVGNCWRDRESVCAPIDLIAQFNKNFDPDLKPDAGWKPALYGPASGAENVESARTRVLDESGPGRKKN